MRLHHYLLTRNSFIRLMLLFFHMNTTEENILSSPRFFYLAFFCKTCLTQSCWFDMIHVSSQLSVNKSYFGYGLSELALSMYIHFMHCVSKVSPLFSFLGSPLRCQNFWGRQLLWAPFLAPSRGFGNEQWNSKMRFSVAQSAVELFVVLLVKIDLYRFVASVRVYSYSFQCYPTWCFATCKSPKGFLCFTHIDLLWM